MLLKAFPLPILLAVVRILAQTSHVVTRTLSVCVLLKYHNVFVCVYVRVRWLELCAGNIDYSEEFIS